MLITKDLLGCIQMPVDLGLGAVLYQKDENGKKQSNCIPQRRTLNQAEKNYPAHKFEFLALKWAVTSRFHEYLYGGGVCSIY